MKTPPFSTSSSLTPTPSSRYQRHSGRSRQQQGQSSQVKVPFSAQAEKALLGAILSDGEYLVEIASEEPLLAEHFFSTPHQHIFRALQWLHGGGHATDFISVLEELKNQEKYPLEIRDEYVISLLQAAPISENILYHAKIIRHTYQLRQIIQTCELTRDLAARQSYEHIEGLLDTLEQEILKIRSEKLRGGLISGSVILESTVLAIEKRMRLEGKLPGVTSGFYDLDSITGGFQASDLIILAARPGMGKTALALNFASAALRDETEKRVAIFSLEMSKEQLMERLLASQGKIDSSRLRRGALSGAKDTKNLLGAVRDVREYTERLVVDDSAGLSINELGARIRRYHRDQGLDLVIVDYLQLMVGSQEARKQGRQREVSEISMGLKALAKELSVPVVAVAQLNRSPDSRPDKRPRISDLRESGSMEQDADLIMFVYRDEYYNPHSQFSGQAEVIIGKNRHGPLSMVRLAYLPSFVSFRNLVLSEKYSSASAVLPATSKTSASKAGTAKQ
ncbi:MAG: replicative DNA helicase [Proteobacteria bacterium]|nr:replicative DNA helicase [Pseudomonadota bacterium]